MRKRVTAIAGASLFATSGLLGAYVGYPGLRRANAAPVDCGTVSDEATLRTALAGVTSVTPCDYIYIQPGTITLSADLPPVTQTASVTITGAGEGQTIISGDDLYRAFYFDGNTGDVSFSDLTIQNADLGTTAGPKGGSAIYSSTNISLSNVTLSDNRNRTGTRIGEGVGAAVWAGNGAVVTASRFTGNVATQFGGAIYNQAGNITIAGSYFADNDAGYDGGAIYNKAGDITITGSTFKRNEATSDGGAVFNTSGAATISGSYFGNNTATRQRGGAVFNTGNDVTITDSTFKTNAVPNGIGGAIYASNGDITITGGTFESNSAERAGAIINNSGGVTLTSSAFTTNRATVMEGGAVFSTGDTTITGSTFTDNTAADVGGAVLSFGKVSITDSTFTGSMSGRTGGAVYAGTTQNSHTITGSTFSGNTASSAGGAFYARELTTLGSVDVLNSTFTDNSASAGSALYVKTDDGTGTLSVNFSTVTANSATTAGGAAVEAASSTDFGITNSILFNNVDSDSPPATRDVATGGNLDLAFSLLTSNASFSPAGPTTPDVLFGNPLLGILADNGGPTQTMMPSANSPVLGAANPAGAPATDQRGYTRTTNGRADMGSVERLGVAPGRDLSQIPPSWFQAQQRREQSATCPPGMVPSWAQWPNEQTGGWTCEWTTWWDVNKGSTGGWVTTPGFNPGLRLPE